MNNPLQQLSEIFARFPGIGHRQARRLSYFLVGEGSERIPELIEALKNAQDRVAQCTHCYRFFISETKGVCSRCTEADGTTMMVVEKDVDLDNIEKTNVYPGRFFVIGGTIPILAENPADKIRARALVSEIDRAIKEDNLSEVILALSANQEGENTSLYLRRILEPIQKKKHITVSVLGRGLSTGTELEYSDSDTLKSAFEGRK